MSGGIPGPPSTGTLRRSIYVAFDASRLVVTIGIKRAAFYWRFQPGLHREYTNVVVPAVKRVAQPTLNRATQQVLREANRGGR